MSGRAGLRLLPAIVLPVLLSGLMAGCSVTLGPPDPSAAYFPTSKPVAHVDPPLAAGVAAGLPEQGVGKVEKPNPALTPGAVSTTNTTWLCQQPKPHRPPMSKPQRDVIFAEYQIPQKQYGRYVVDYLVPLELGGSLTESNMWPMHARGTSYAEKQHLAARMRTRVCNGQVTLAQAQAGFEKDWFELYAQNVA